MRLLREFAILLLVFFSGAVIDGDQPKSTVQAKPGTTTAPCGRYQLFQGLFGMPGSIEQHRLLRIDNQTGNTWVYFEEGMATANPREGWIELPEWQRTPKVPSQ